MRYLTATALATGGMPLLVTRWPLPMVGLAFICAGALLAVGAARASRRTR